MAEISHPEPLAPRPEMQIHGVHWQIDVHDIKHLDFQNVPNPRNVNVRSVNRNPHARRAIHYQRAYQIRRPLRSSGIVNQRSQKPLELPVVVIRWGEQNPDQSEYHEYQNTRAYAPDVSGPA